MKKYDIIIIGGGAAGMMAAYSALKDSNLKILLLEKNEKLGKKIYITGKGRCNVTNSIDLSEFFDNITRNPYFMYSSLYGFSNRDTMDFFTSHGLKLKEERGNRVFPNSDKSSDVIKTLEKAIKGVHIKLNTKVLEVKKINDEFIVETDRENFSSDKLIIATGGLSYPGTGSTGDGYKFAKKMGHTITELKPSLCPLLTDEKDIHMVTGLTVKNAEITLFVNGKKDISYFGDFLFTHRGISGPIVLTLSDYIGDLKDKKLELFVNFKPSIPISELEDRLLKDIDNYPKREIKTLLLEYFPKSLGEFLSKKLSFSEKTKLHEIDRIKRSELLELFTKFDLKYLEPDHIRQAVVTKGGVDVDEVDPKTMESKIVKNLYLCGELLDVNGLTGGYNLQIAFSTGYAAGLYAKEIDN